MSILYLLQEIRNPILDAIVSVITLLGEETVFMAFGMVIFWCFDKYQGYYLLCTGFFGTLLNQFLKMVFRIPRPWIKDPEFEIVEAAREAATGYSFPSGHTQSSVGLFGGIARWNRNRAVRIISVIICILVPFSRLYLGVHTLADVAVSFGLALILVFLCHPLFKRAAKSSKLMYGIIAALTVATVAHLLFLEFFPFDSSVYETANIENLISARKNAYTLLGCMIGLIAVYTVDLHFTRFETDAVWWAQIIKAVCGIAIVLIIKSGLKAPLEALFNGHPASRSVRYFIVVIAAGMLWPMTFKRFSRLGKKSTSEKDENI